MTHYNRLLLVVSILFLLSTQVLYSQSNSDTLNTVNIIEHKKYNNNKDSFTVGQTKQSLNNRYKVFYLDASLSQLIAQQSSVFIKSYGINNLATLSLRGASAAQSSVLWNGVPINNPALGVADISLLQTGMFNDVSLQYGSSGALYGSGNIGGALMLNSQNDNFSSEKKQIQVGLSGGSFNTYNIAAKAIYNNSKWNTSLYIFQQHALNNFHYLYNNKENKRMDNAKLNAMGAMLSTNYNLNKKNHALENNIGIDIWYQKYEREIPPALFESLSDKLQTDQSLRTLLHWSFKKSYYELYTKASFNIESFHYEDPTIHLFSKSNVNQYYQEVGIASSIKLVRLPNLHQKVLLFFPLQYVSMDSKDTGTHSQFRPALAFAYTLKYNNFSFSTSLRQEWWNGNSIPLLPGVGIEYKVGNFNLLNNYYVSFNAKANLQRTYRIPTLNELYITPGGNSQLRPEQGWSREIGYTLKMIHKLKDDFIETTILKHELVYFNRDIKDWIIWLGGAIWTPHNLAEVNSRGIATHNQLEIPIRNVKLLIGFNTSYVLSTNVKPYLLGDSSEGRQIPYTPRYIYQSNMGIQWNNLFINYNHTYTGYRFITMDESQYLKPYSLGNVQIAYSFRWKLYDFRVTTQIQNIWNTPYEVVAQRPMPGRYFRVGVQMYFND